jgi:hypothetical protein
VAPEHNNNIVLSKGNSEGPIASIPTGGHTPPNSIVGAIAEWKKAQNIAMKKNNSETTNKINPIFNPFLTAKV